MIVEIACLALAALGLAFGIRFYIELWKWARMCQHARITVAYKRKVKVDAPLVEWLLWTNQLKKDQMSAGRVIYSAGGTSVAILRPVKGEYGWRSILLSLRRNKNRKSGAPPVREIGQHNG